jgi:uncharacterized protein with NRDE domain
MVAANRDERLDRPAVAATVLRDTEPRILGGRDQLAGGTWLAVSDRGVVAGLTNQPAAGGRDPSKRSRGELPLLCACEPSANQAMEALAASVDPARYNPCWMLVGDRNTLFAVGIGAGSAAPEIERLTPGLHVLENAPLRAESPKAAFVRALVGQRLAAQPGAGAAAVTEILQAVLRDHDPAVPEPRTDASGRVWPASLTAACVHAEGYGTRSSAIVTVPAAGLPSMLVADGRPCETPMRDVSALWAADPGEEPAEPAR